MTGTGTGTGRGLLGAGGGGACAGTLSGGSAGADAGGAGAAARVVCGGGGGFTRTRSSAWRCARLGRGTELELELVFNRSDTVSRLREAVDTQHGTQRQPWLRNQLEAGGRSQLTRWILFGFWCARMR